MGTHEQALESLKTASEELEAAEEKARQITGNYFALGNRTPSKPIPTPPVLDEAARWELEEAWANEDKAH